MFTFSNTFSKDIDNLPIKPKRMIKILHEVAKLKMIHEIVFVYITHMRRLAFQEYNYGIMI